MTLFLLFRNRRAREAAILQAIENGVETLFDIVANVYSEVPRSFWIPAASNVRLHVDHLADQNKLPKVCVTIVLKIFSSYMAMLILMHVSGTLFLIYGIFLLCSSFSL